MRKPAISTVVDTGKTPAGAGARKTPPTVVGIGEAPAEAGARRIPTVVGIDLSLSSTGVAIWKNHEWGFHNPKTKGTRSDPWGVRTRRVQALASQITPFIPRHALVVVEGPSYNSISTSTWERAALYYQVLAAVVNRECWLGVVPPMVLKQWATGTGTSLKQPVMNVAQQFTSITMPNDDIADAAILVLMGLHKLGVLNPPGSWRQQTLRQVRWEKP